MNVEELSKLIWDVDYGRKSLKSKEVRKAFDEADYETWIEALKDGDTDSDENVRSFFTGSTKYPIQKYVQDRWPEIADVVKQRDFVPKSLKELQDLTLIDDKEVKSEMTYEGDDDISPAVRNKWYFHSPSHLSKDQYRDWLRYSQDPENLAKIAAEQGGDEPVYDPNEEYEGLTEEDIEFLKDLKFKDLLDKKTRDSYNKIARKKDSNLIPLDGRRVSDIQLPGNDPGSVFTRGGTVKSWLRDIENWEDDTAPSRSLDPLEIEVNKMSPEELYKYLEENYPDESKEEQLEDLAEKEPEKAIEAKDIIPNTAKEAEQVLDSNPHNNEANNEEIKKDVGKFLNEGYEDGMLKRSEEQQAEFDKIKEQSEREAAEWRRNQAAKQANAANETSNPTESSPEIGEQPIESKPLDDADISEEMKRFEGSKKRSTKRLTDMDSNPLESLEFNPTEFNKQYEIDHPELRIKDELSDEEKNDIDYKPSQEELDALNQANREEWEANGRPRNKDLPDKTIDLPNDFMDKEVERQIEENPSQAEQVAERSLGENNPIENEAEQAADPTNPQDDEVNNVKIASASTEDKQEFLNEMEPDYGVNLGGANLDGVGSQLTPNQVYNQELNAPEVELGGVTDRGIEDLNNYPDKPFDWSKIQAQNDARWNTTTEPKLEEKINSDDTIAIENNAPELDIEKIPEEKMRKIFDPLNKEIETRQKAFEKASEDLALAQMHFDEDPNEENAKALQRADRAYKDAEFLLNRKQEEFSEAYKNLGNYYQPKEEEEEEEEEESESEKPLNWHLPSYESHRLNGISSTNSTTPLNDIEMEHRGGRGIGSAGRGFLGNTVGGSGSAHPATHGLSNPNVRTDSLQSAASKAPIPQLAKDNSHEITRSGSTNNTPHSNGSLGSGGGLMFSHNTNYTSPSKVAPTIASLGHTSTPSAGIMNVGGIGGTGKKGMDPKMILISAIESRINELVASNPDILKKLGLDHKYKHWSWKGIALDELGTSQLQELWKELN